MASKSWLHYSDDEATPEASPTKVRKLDINLFQDDSQLTVPLSLGIIFSKISVLIAVSEYHSPCVSPNHCSDDETPKDQGALAKFIQHKLTSGNSSSGESGDDKEDDKQGKLPDEFAKLTRHKVSRKQAYSAPNFAKYKKFACQKDPNLIKLEESRNLNKEITDILQILEGKSNSRFGIQCQILESYYIKRG